MSIAIIQPEIEVQPGPQLVAVHNPGEIFRFGGGFNVGRSAVRWSLLVPENRLYDGIAAIAPGYSGIEGSSEAPAWAHANEGIPTAWFSPARRSDQSFLEDLADAQRLHALTIKSVFQAIIDKKLAIMSEVPDSSSLSLTRRSIVAHSMGGLSATLYARAETGSTESILHKASCGFGHPNLAELAASVPKGAFAGLRHELIPSLLRGDIALTKENGRQMLDYFRHRQALAEGLSCLRVNVCEDTQRLMDRGVQVDYEAYAHDILVRPDPGTAQFVHTHRIMPQAGHLAPIHKSRPVARGSAKTMLAL